jgi:hypothetical protein
MSKKMSQNFNDSYTSAITASTENQDQSFSSKVLENTNDILLIHLNEFPINNTFKKTETKKTPKKKLSNKTFFLSKPSLFKEDDINTEKWFTNKIRLNPAGKNSKKILYQLLKDDKFKKTHSHQVLMAQKEKGIYIIRNNFGICAKIRWNLFSNHFKVFDESNNLIEEIIYEFNFKGINGPTKLKILLPKITKNEKSLVNITGNKKLVYNMKNKSPVYNDFFKVYTLQFIRRKVIPNEKNFQIIFSDYKEDSNDILLQFAQSENDEFILDFKHPFNNITAFALAITAMSSRTFCK